MWIEILGVDREEAHAFAVEVLVGVTVMCGEGNALQTLTIFGHGSSYPMHVSLTPELEKAVKNKVASGLYNNASEVIREALRIAMKQEVENEWLKREAAIGFAQLEAGETVRVRTKKQFLELARRQS